MNINVENESNFFPGEKFNLILVLDVLEHLVDPWKFLKMIKSRLSDRGTLIISVPNIRHYSVIKDLIFFGRWEYEESGILDSTHLRFFTKKSLLKMFNNEQLKNEVILNYPIDFRGKAKILNMLTLNFFSNFLTQTYFFKLEKC